MMSTIHREAGFEVLIYLNDHRPAHVHVFKAEGEVVVFLGDTGSLPQIRENIGMSGRDERAVLVLVGEHQSAF